ncbi:MAG: RNase adapter RapZ [Acidobacteriota bacterium]|nr:RNase adapter RapZ [Acidobacteriota bacterium]MDQ7086748.1 RNase adapter RapZ [Acidobacteriota bacterium]
MIKLVVLSGLSGSGKTLALRCLEDMGYFSVDNLPVPLIPPFVDLLDRGEELEPQGAFVVDARERGHLDALPAIVADLRDRKDLRLTVLFLEASEDVLVRRFSESRRPHPVALQDGLGVAGAIAREKDLLAGLRELADRVIATDDLSPHDLRRQIKSVLSDHSETTDLLVRLVSFGFKHGLPRDVDLVFDVRFIENPYFQPGLRELSGRDEDVTDFLESQPDYIGFCGKLEELLAFVMPRYVFEGKSYLTIAFGCTGGRHRSVALAERTARYLGQSGFRTQVQHRDIERGARRESS